jgi:hypothetical protein
MNWLKPNWRLGVCVACIVIVGLIVIPPLIAPHLDEWEAAASGLPATREVQLACGNNATIELSRWFYSFKVSGANGYAKFRGRASSAICNRSFVVEQERRNYTWRIDKVTWDE